MECQKCGKTINNNLLLCPYCGTANPTENLKNTNLLNSYSDKLQELINRIGTAEQFPQSTKEFSS